MALKDECDQYTYLIISWINEQKNYITYRFYN